MDMILFIMFGVSMFATGTLVGHWFGPIKVIYITPEEEKYMKDNSIDNVADRLELNPYNLPKGLVEGWEKKAGSNPTPKNPKPDNPPSAQNRRKK